MFEEHKGNERNRRGPRAFMITSTLSVKQARWEWKKTFISLVPHSECFWKQRQKTALRHCTYVNSVLGLYLVVLHWDTTTPTLTLNTSDLFINSADDPDPYYCHTTRTTRKAVHNHTYTLPNAQQSSSSSSSWRSLAPAPPPPIQPNPTPPSQPCRYRSMMRNKPRLLHS